MKEKINAAKITIFVLAFIGAILIIKPDFNLNIYPAMIGLFGTIVTAVAHVALRSLRLTDHPLVIVNYFGYVIGLLSLGLLLWQGNFVVPDALSVFILLLVGLVGLAAQIAFTKAYRIAPTKSVSFYLYLQIVFSAIIGVLFFKEIPGIYSIFGASLIILSGYLNFIYNKEEEYNGKIYFKTNKR